MRKHPRSGKDTGTKQQVLAMIANQTSILTAVVYYIKFYLYNK